MADFEIPAHNDDLCLAGVLINLALQADYAVIWSTSVSGTQDHVGAFMPLNSARLELMWDGVKTLCMAVGKLHSPLPRIYLAGMPLRFVEHTKILLSL